MRDKGGVPNRCLYGSCNSVGVALWRGMIVSSMPYCAELCHGHAHLNRSTLAKGAGSVHSVNVQVKARALCHPLTSKVKTSSIVFVGPFWVGHNTNQSSHQPQIT